MTSTSVSIMVCAWLLEPMSSFVIASEITEAYIAIKCVSTFKILKCNAITSCRRYK